MQENIIENALNFSSPEDISAAKSILWNTSESLLKGETWEADDIFRKAAERAHIEDIKESLNEPDGARVLGSLLRL